MPLASRLLVLDLALTDLLLEHRPDSAAVAEVFVNNNPQSTLKLGQARGVVLLGAYRSGLEVGEYAARLVKQSVVGVGNHIKEQVNAILGHLLTGIQTAGATFDKGPWV